MKKLLLFILLSISQSTKPFFVLEPWNVGIWFYGYCQHGYFDDEIIKIKEKLKTDVIPPEIRAKLEEKQEKLEGKRDHYARIKKVTKTIFQIECALTATAKAAQIAVAAGVYYRFNQFRNSYQN